MPEMIPLGWFHTVMGAVAIISGVIALYCFKEISTANRSGLVYVVTTFITAATALMIYQHGAFGPAHVLAVATLVALAVGLLTEKVKPFGKLSRYIQAFSYTATLLFHSIPAVSDFLLRLPVGDPFLTSFEDPVMKRAHLTLMVMFLVGVTLQLLWIKRQPASS